jgi:predicted alpha-1,2-mannosidase
VKVSGGSDSERRTFYSSLYRTLLAPNTFSDTDGRYTGMDGRVHRVRGRQQYANISGWDTYRTQSQLLALLYPEEASEIGQSIIADADESGCLPRWALANSQTNIMVGDPSPIILANFWAFGARDFDLAAAVKHALRGATEPCETADGAYVQRNALDAYQELGYVPRERTADPATRTLHPEMAWGDAATTLEYAASDFAIAQLAKAAGDRTDAQKFIARAGNWRNLVNPATKTIAPRGADGAFAPQAGISIDGYVEGSAAQYAWMVPHDMRGLIASMGGPAVAEQRLDAFLGHLNGGPASEYAFMGNEPSLHTPWIYHWLGKPAKTRAAVSRALRLYKPTPSGLPGNDDGGTLAAWWVLAALGMYPVEPGTDRLAMTPPVFDKVTITSGQHVVRRSKGAERELWSSYRELFSRR